MLAKSTNYLLSVNGFAKSLDKLGHILPFGDILEISASYEDSLYADEH